MSVFDFLFMGLPVAFLILSVMIAVKAVSRGKSRKRAGLETQDGFCRIGSYDDGCGHESGCRHELRGI